MNEVFLTTKQLTSIKARISFWMKNIKNTDEIKVAHDQVERVLNSNKSLYTSRLEQLLLIRRILSPNTVEWRMINEMIQLKVEDGFVAGDVDFKPMKATRLGIFRKCNFQLYLDELVLRAYYLNDLKPLHKEAKQFSIDTTHYENAARLANVINNCNLEQKGN